MEHAADRAAVPQADVIDSHTHLSLCEPPDEELVEEAVQAGVARLLTVGVDLEGSRASSHGARSST